MGWLSSLFSSDNSQKTRMRKGQAISSTHDAFSIPTSSPVSSHPDAFNPDSLPTPDLNQSYTYPPPNSGSYGYVPTSAGSNTRTSSLLPLHNDPRSGYPPLAVTWNRLREWLGREYPELGDTLNYGILPQDLAEIEMQFGFALPAAVRDSYLSVNGQEAESSAGCAEGLFFGLTLLPLEDVLEEWRFWREVDDDPSTGANAALRDMMQSIPPNWVRKEYSQRGWVPLVADKAGNYIGIDLNPAEAGHVGQVIVFGRDFDTKVVLWKGDGSTGWAKWLASFVEELESGEGYEIGGGNEQSEGSEDDVGYESYFYDGNGRGQGDGGGDSGSGGGLRLTGEYRGWSPLEAWADRSLRKWYDLGLIPDSALEQGEKVKPSPDIDLGGLAGDGTDVEVPIPVLDESTSALAVPDASSSRASPRPDLPTISVTKPPAPRPVELPTPTQIRPPSPSEFDDPRFNRHDLESGNPEQPLFDLPPSPSNEPPPVPLISLATVDLPTPSGAVSPTTVPLPVTPTSAATSTLPEASSSSSSTMHDFLADIPGEMDSTSTLVDIAVAEPDVASDSVTTPTAAEPDKSFTENPDADVTIRLIGSGGVAGLVDDAVPEEPPTAIVEELDLEGDNASIHSVNSIASNASAASQASVSVTGTDKDKPSKKPKHTKTSSGLASLKKFGGHLGGLRKKDSASSVKDAAAPASKPTSPTN